MTPLQQLVVDRMAELGLTFREAGRRAKGRASASLFNNIATGKRGGNFTDDVLEGIALALDLPLSKVRKAAGESVNLPTEFKLPKKANKLTDQQRRVVIDVVNAMLDGRD